MKKLLLITGVFIFVFLFSGCAMTRANYLPALSNAKVYSKCSPVYETHVPGLVAQSRILMDALVANPTMADKVVPVSGTLDVVGKNAAQIGTGVAATVTAINGDVSIASIVGSAVMAGTKALMDARSEDRTQQRVSVCMPDDSDLVVFQNENAKLMVIKKATAEMADAMKVYMENDKPTTFKALKPQTLVDEVLEGGNDKS